MSDPKEKLTEESKKDLADNDEVKKEEEKCPLVYKDAPYHGDTAQGLKNPRPTNGQSVLERSVQVSPTSSRRIGVDPNADEIVVFVRTHGNEYHGHVRSWDELTPKMQAVLRKAGLVDKKGKIM